jgi:flagellar basal body-associated protein FliL
MINGQTGKVNGAKPRDLLKLTLLITILVFMLVLIILVYWMATKLNLTF